MTQLLVVDDDEDFAGAVRMVLQSRGFDVAMEHDTAKALQRIEQRQPDAVILNVMFPEDPLAGVELARAVRNQFPKLPILMLTAICRADAAGVQQSRHRSGPAAGDGVPGKTVRLQALVRQTRPPAPAADVRDRGERLSSPLPLGEGQGVRAGRGQSLRLSEETAVLVVPKAQPFAAPFGQLRAALASCRHPADVKIIRKIGAKTQRTAISQRGGLMRFRRNGWVCGMAAHNRPGSERTRTGDRRFCGGRRDDRDIATFRQTGNSISAEGIAFRDAHRQDIAFARIVAAGNNAMV